VTQANLSPPQFHQLPLFMTAREIKARYRPSPADKERVKEDGDRWETPEETWSRKAQEARETGHAADIMKEGPTGQINIEVARGMVIDGHHRTGFMAEYDPDRPMAVRFTDWSR
jgi:hypothetical protein